MTPPLPQQGLEEIDTLRIPEISQKISKPFEPLAKLCKTVTPEKAGVQKSLKNLDSGLRQNDEKGFLQEAPLPPRFLQRHSIVREICRPEYLQDSMQRSQGPH